MPRGGDSGQTASSESPISFWWSLCPRRQRDLTETPSSGWWSLLHLSAGKSDEWTRPGTFCSWETEAGGFTCAASRAGAELPPASRLARVVRLQTHPLCSQRGFIIPKMGSFAIISLLRTAQCLQPMAERMPSASLPCCKDPFSFWGGNKTKPHFLLFVQSSPLKN